MCGIAGYVGNRNLSAERLDQALDTMRRRGPDSGSWKHWKMSSGRHLCLLHSRLSIIDLDHRADQPIRSGGTWLSFNGELYNYIEVGDRLRRSGVRFRTSSDSEVMAAVLAQRHGTDEIVTFPLGAVPLGVRAVQWGDDGLVCGDPAAEQRIASAGQE